MTSAAAYVQNRLVSEPISFKDPEPWVFLWPNPPLPLVSIKTLVAIVTAVVPVLVAVFVLLLLLLSGVSGTSLRSSTPAGGGTDVM